MDKLPVKRSIALSVVSVIVSFMAFLKIVDHHNTGAAEILIILILGMGISALIFNVANLYTIKK